MYVDERVGDKPNETEREIERERERKKLGLCERCIRVIYTRSVCIWILYTWKEKRQHV